MKKLIVLIIVIIFQTHAFAQEMTCLDKLLPFNRYSGQHQVSKEEWNDGKEVIDSESARSALTYLTNAKLFCKTNEVVIKVAPICSTIIADLPQSNTCFMYTNVGYFVLSRDLGRNMNFIFSKDKRFADPKQ
jgi:hypothetical protein